MIGLATTTVSVYRDSASNVFGDPTDANAAPVLIGVPASILEQSRTTSRRASDRPQTTRYATGRVPHGTGVLLGDRLKDEGTGLFYLVTEVHRMQNPIMAQDQVVALERTPTQ